MQINLFFRFNYYSLRMKKCECCQKKFNVMYRIQYKANKHWVFVCEKCLIEVKFNNNHYRYGGTWKG